MGSESLELMSSLLGLDTGMWRRGRPKEKTLA